MQIINAFKAIPKAHDLQFTLSDNSFLSLSDL